MTKVSKKSKLLTLLQKGSSVTEKVAESRLKLKNLSATISDLREEGHRNIQTEHTSDGRVKYVMI